ncbi:hypothetical protein HMPREF1415_00824 [Helicobacter pylori GAM254Ai]|nr:hypothetical protein HMPREF1415_00824 [Helicobacter pylori GAM254Ai]
MPIALMTSYAKMKTSFIKKEFNVSNVITDYSQYNEKQLQHFLNSIEKQLLKAEGDKNKAIKKIQECESQEQMIRQVLAQKHSQEKEPTQSLLNTIASKDDPEYDVSFGDFNDFLQIAKQEMLRKYHPQRRGLDEHLGDNIDFLILMLNRIKNGEIKLIKVSQLTPTHYKRIVKESTESKESLEYIVRFINALTSSNRQYSAYERLFVKMLNLTPIKASELITIKCSDFYVKGDYCLVANKYLLFIPLFLEAKSIPKDETLLINNIIKYQFISKGTPTIQNASTINWRIVKAIGYNGVAQNEFAIRLLYYFVNLGLSELGEALTWTQAGYKMKKKLGLPL